MLAQAGQQRRRRHLRGLARISRRAERTTRPMTRSLTCSRSAACIRNHTAAPSSPARRPAIAVPIALTAISLLSAAVSTGLIGLVSVAIRKEDKDLTLTSQATSTLTRAGRRLTGVHVVRSAPQPPS